MKMGRWDGIDGVVINVVINPEMAKKVVMLTAIADGGNWGTAIDIMKWRLHPASAPAPRTGLRLLVDDQLTV
jgi:hypothetical protein